MQQVSANRAESGRTEKSNRRNVRIALQCLFAVALFVAAGGMSGAACMTGGGGTTPTFPTDEQRNALKIVSDDHVLGLASAPITIFEYADFQCPFCGRFARETMPTVKSEFIATGKVRYVFRHFPLRSIHQCAESSSRGAECVGNQKPGDNDFFFSFADLLFNNQTPADNLCNNGLNTLVTNNAAALGIDASAFSSCLAAGTPADRVQRDVNSGILLGIEGTPAFYIVYADGSITKQFGLQSIEQMRALLNK